MLKRLCQVLPFTQKFLLCVVKLGVGFGRLAIIKGSLLWVDQVEYGSSPKVNSQMVDGVDNDLQFILVHVYLFY